MTPHEQIQQSISELQNALIGQNPRMPLILREIHSKLKNEPHVVTLLTEDEIHNIVLGLEKQTTSHIVSSMAKPKSPKAALKNVTTDDLGF